MAGSISTRVSEYQNKGSKHDYAYRKIKEWIIEGELPPDTIIVERQMCDLLHLSRTPIRSALQELAKEGFLIMAPGRGMMVSRIHIEDLIEIFEIRRFLDILALELFMKRDLPDIVRQMRDTVEEMKTALQEKNYFRIIQADNRFHELYSRNTGNGRLERMCEELCEQQRRIAAMTFNDEEWCVKACEAHEAIMDRIEEGDVDNAKRLLQKHLTDSMEHHIQSMSNKAL